MSEVYKFKRRPARAVIWVTLLCVILFGAFVYVNQLAQFYWLVAGCALISVVWLLLPRPIYGIKVDDTHLTLAAWRKPRPVPLDRIAHLQATEHTDEIGYVIVYKDDEYEGIFSLDLPDEETLIEIMAERGIPVRARL